MKNEKILALRCALLIAISEAEKNLPIDKKCLYHGAVRGMRKDDPMNKAHVSFLMALDDAILVEISFEGRSHNAK